MALKDYLMIFKNTAGIIDFNVESFEEIIEEAKQFDVELCPQQTNKLPKVAPCIAKVGKDHFILIIRVESGLVIYTDNGITISTPVDDFLPLFSGYVLSERVVGKLLSRKKCKEIIGHKKGKDILKGLAPILAGVLAGPLGPIASAAASGLTKGATQGFKGKFAKDYLPTMAGSYFGGKAMSPGVNAAKGAGGNYGSQLWQGGRTLLGMQPSMTQGGLPGSGSIPSMGANAGGVTGAAGTTPGSKMYYAPGTGWSSTTAADQGVTTGYGLLGRKTLGDMSPFQPNATNASGEGIASKGMDMFGGANKNLGSKVLGGGSGTGGTNLSQLALGTGLLGASTMPKMPEAPEYPSEIGGMNLSERVMGGSALGQLGTKRAMEIMQGDPMTEEDESAIIGQFERRQADAMSSLDEQYNSIGRLNSGEHLEAKQKMNDEWENQKAILLYQARKDYQTMQNNVMQASWGYDLQQMSQIMDYADRVGRKQEIDYMIKAGDAMGLKNLLGQLAGLAFGSAVGA